MNDKQFRYVIALAREGSFSRAAESLNISQPSLSQYIKKIETEVGLPLFDRTGGDVRLTDAGRVCVEAGRKILDLEHQMDVSFSNLAQNKAGSLIIGTAPYRAAGMMPQVARRFMEAFPGMHLIVREGTTVELSEGMEHGEYDMALTIKPIDERIFASALVTREELLLAVPGDRAPLKARAVEGRRCPAVDAAVLDGQALVMLTQTQSMRRQLDDIVFERGLTVYPAAVVKSLEAQIAMVRAGVGMALVPSGIERFCGPGEVTFYSFTEALPRREVVVMWRRDRALSAAAQALKNIILDIPW